MNKKVDALGRIVIPIELRKKYDLNEGATVLFKEENGLISISPAKRCCKLCKKELANENPVLLCQECINHIKNFY